MSKRIQLFPGWRPRAYAGVKLEEPEARGEEWGSSAIWRASEAAVSRGFIHHLFWRGLMPSLEFLGLGAPAIKAHTQITREIRADL